MRPRSLSHYRIDAELGRGGMGIVYQAFDTRLQRPVAVKILAEEIAGDVKQRSRVLEEARAASALNHPAITTVYEVGDQDGSLFIVMELIAGRTLRAAMQARPLDVRTLLDTGVQIAEALANAHSKGVVHGDIKPENVMLRADGGVKLLDFGIARRIATDPGAPTALVPAAGPAVAAATLGGAGTLPYMAPEVLDGGSRDSRSDLFALGVLLYEVAAGRRPFRGATPTALLADILHGSPDALTEVVPSLPFGFAQVTHRLLQKDPGQRPQTATEISTALSAVLRDFDLASMLPANLAGKRAVAVLPFRLLTPDPSDAYLGTALADAVINRLSEGGSLLVRPTNAVLRFGNAWIDPIAAGRELNVHVVVDGSVQRMARRLRVQVQARLVEDGTVLISAHRDADMVDLFGLQDAVADDLRRVLVPGSSGSTAERASPATVNPKAYELFLRASGRLVAFNRWDTRSAIDMLEDATRLDPAFDDAWARLGEARVLMRQSFEPDDKWLSLAQRAIRRALALNPHNALAHSARARTLWTPAGYKVDATLHSTSMALHLNAGCHPAWAWQGVVLYHIGLPEDARKALTSALASHPNDPFALCFLGQTFFEERDYERASDFTERALAIDRGGLYANLLRPIIALYRDQHAEAERCIREARSATGQDSMLLAYEAVIHAKEGRSAKSQAAVRKALSGHSLVHSHHTFHLAAVAYAVLGNPRRSVELLRKAATSGFPNYAGFRDDLHFRPLHRYAPFLKLMADLKREVARHERKFRAAQR